MTGEISREQFAQLFDVPRGTMAKFDRYAALLAEWQQRMNLVGPATIASVWDRHFADSAQLTRHVPAGKHWLDIGAGGGFPGLVLATLGWGQFTLVDSVAKKCRFLEAVRDELDLGASVAVLPARVEQLPTLGVEVATARATAALGQLFDWSIRHIRPGGTCIFPKGRRWSDEVMEARARFDFDLQAEPSMTDGEARILIARNLKRR